LEWSNLPDLSKGIGELRRLARRALAALSCRNSLVHPVEIALLRLA